MSLFAFRFLRSTRGLLDIPPPKKEKLNPIHWSDGQNIKFHSIFFRLCREWRKSSNEEQLSIALL